MPTSTQTVHADTSALPAVVCNGSEEPKLRAKDVAALLGVSVDTVYRHVPCIRVSPRAIRYNRAVVAQYLDTNALPFARRRRTRFTRRKRRV
jgi:predicted DNA-binding transcriptional regulator AlpA